MEHWPALERAAAEKVLATSPAARALLVEMQQVETALRATCVRPTADDIARIAARSSAFRQETRTRRMMLRAGVGTAAAAVFAIGILVGGLWPAPGTRAMSPDRLLAAALETGGAGDVD